MRIAVVGPTHPYKGGIAQHTTQLTHALGRAGHEVVLEGWRNQYPATLYKGQLTVPEDRPEIPVFPRTERLLSWNRPDSWLRVAERVAGADVVVLVVGNAVQIAPFLTMLLVLRRRGARVVALVHNVDPHEGHVWDERLMRSLLQHVDAVMVHSDAQAEVARDLGTREVHVHELPPNLGETTEVPARRRAGADEPLDVLFFGLVRPYKGLDVLLRALPAAPGTRLTVAGEFWSPKEETEALIDELGVADRVTLDDGYVASENLPALFGRHDLVALPYRSVTGSGIIKVAYGFNRPIIVSDIGTLAEEIKGGLGLTFPPEDPAAIAEVLRRAADPDVYNPMAEAVAARPKDLEGEWAGYVEQLLGGLA